MTLEARASEFAALAHQGQKRKYTGEDYIEHPAEVVEIVRGVPDHTEEMLAAAWLHDVVEDCGVFFGDIETRFGQTVCRYVYWLTNASRPDHGNRAARKLIDRNHIYQAPKEAKTIKLADLISNTSSIVQHDPKFAVTYLKEKRDLLEVLRQGDSVLWKRADIQTTEAVARLKGMMFGRVFA